MITLFSLVTTLDADFLSDGERGLVRDGERAGVRGGPGAAVQHRQRTGKKTLKNTSFIHYFSPDLSYFITFLASFPKKNVLNKDSMDKRFYSNF